jgi:hypothetical protein
LVTDKHEKAVSTAKERKAELETKLKWKQKHQKRSQKFGAVRTKASPKFWKNIRSYAEH